jgi:cytochrome bd-type quinol oxidase subunit 2
MAASFSGFYLAFFLLLWCLILRGVSLEVGGHIDDPLWRAAWSFCFVVSNVLLAILIGAALGNLIRGVPVGAEGKFAMALFTNFSPYGQVGILDWYTVSVAGFVLALFAAINIVASILVIRVRHGGRWEWIETCAHLVADRVYSGHQLQPLYLQLLLPWENRTRRGHRRSVLIFGNSNRRF